MDQTIQQLTDFGVGYGIQIVGAILILIAGWIGAGIFRRLVRRSLLRAKLDATVADFLGQVIYFIVLLLAVLAMLAKFGVQTTSFVAVLGAAGFAVGLALQGSLSHFAAGLLILIFRPFKVGDLIDAGGVLGTVEEIRLFTTVLASPDNIRVIVPNSKVFNDTIRNYSVNDTRRIDLPLGIAYGASIDRAMEVLREVMKADSRVIREPEPQVVVSDFGESSVNLLVQCWTKRGDYWAAKCDLAKKIKENFDIQGIEIPYPHRVVRVVQARES